MGHGKMPMLVRVGTTRWLSWYSAVKAHAAQYDELGQLFEEECQRDDKCEIAKTLLEKHMDRANYCFMVFLRPILQEIAGQNVAFQKSHGDISALYRDLKSFVVSLAKRVVKPEAIRLASGSSMLRVTELDALRQALGDDANLKSIDMVSYGRPLMDALLSLHVGHTASERCTVQCDKKRAEVKGFCRRYLITLVQELMDRLPSCIDTVEKMRALAPKVALAVQGRPQFNQLPTDLVKGT